MPRDTYGNALPAGAVPATALSLSVTGPASVAVNPTEVLPSGELRASYTPAASGSHQVDVMLGGTPLTGSPFAVKVQSGPQASNCLAASTPPNGTRVIAGDTMAVQVEARDQDGTKVIDAALVLVAEVVKLDNGAAVHTASLALSASTQLYQGTVTLEAAGWMAVKVLLYGSAVPPSPLLFEVEPALPANSSWASGPA